MTTSYTPDFFDWQESGSLRSAQVIAPVLNKVIAPTTVLDVGCGLGTWASQWPASIGVDGDYVHRDRLKIPVDRFVPLDLQEPLDLGKRFDMVLCLEVAEHLPPSSAETLVASLVHHGDVVVFSAAVPGQGGIDHVNEQWPTYWAALFAVHGYKPYDLIRRDLWWDQRIEWWYRQNIVVFASDEAAATRGWVESPWAELDLAQPALLMPELAGHLDATVCIPWRPSPSRMAAFERVQAYWSQFGWPVIVADSDTEVFSLAQARNNAVARSKTEIVVISDADSLIDPLNVLRAVAEPTGVCWPFTKYRILDAQYIDLPYEQLVSVPYANTWDGDGVAGVGGCMVTTRSEYWRLGGQPPEFIGWGWEDTAFTCVVRTLSIVKRARGYLYSFEHNTDAANYTDAKADSPGWDRDVERNRHLMAPYLRCDQRPWMMRHLIKERRVGS